MSPSCMIRPVRTGFRRLSRSAAGTGGPGKPHRGVRAQAPADLTPDQVTDFVTLRRARYSAEEAAAIVRRPRPRLRATLLEARHG